MFKTIPVEAILDFRGKHVKAQRLDNDMEKVFKLAYCPGPDCSYSTTSLEDLQGHLESHDDKEIQEANVNLIPELINSDTRYIILNILQALSITNPQHPIMSGKVRRLADSFHAGKVWTVVWESIESNLKEIKLNKKQYDWLHQVLERRLVEKGIKEEERITVAEQLFGLSWYKTVQYLLTLDERESEETKVVLKEVT